MNKELQSAIEKYDQGVYWYNFNPDEVGRLIDLGLKVIWFCEGGMATSKQAALASNKDDLASVYYRDGLRGLTVQQRENVVWFRSIKALIERVPHSIILQSKESAINNHSTLTTGPDAIANFTFEGRHYRGVIEDLLKK